MCGIVGIIYKDINRMCNEQTLIAMRDAQFHRGPDEEGILIDGNAGLGHRRLSIIDLSSGRQPMTNEDGSLWIVYNGEIYNFKTLREDLLKKGHFIRSHSDTEVILHLYEEKGSACVDDLNGMFAFAIWDKNKRTLFMARDRMGEKPLYYVLTNEVFLFSSEIKSLFKSGHLKAECNESSLYEYFLFRHISGEGTMFNGVKNLLPGHTLTLKDGALEIKRYWSPFPIYSRNEMKFEEATEHLSHLLQDAVKIRMVSDVPLGTFCSGGVDSSLVTAIAARSVNHPINTFSVGFHENDYDETSYARMVSKQYRTNHHEIKLDNKEFADLLPKMIWHNDEPLNFANSIHIYAISKLAKEYVTVVLTGEGADELFAGYPRYLVPKLLATYQKLPTFIQKVFDAGLGLISGHRAEKLRTYSHYSMQDMLIYNASFLKRDFLSDIFPKYHNEGFDFRKKSIIQGNAIGLDLITNLSILDQQTYLVSILMRQDKMSMAASVESRVPFLDYRLVEFANSLPEKFKIRRFMGKYILKKVAGGFLPDEVIHRRKSGFGVPLGGWLRENKGMGAIARSLLDDNVLGAIIEERHVKGIINEHTSGAGDHSELLWELINISLWKKVFKV